MRSMELSGTGIVNAPEISAAFASCAAVPATPLAVTKMAALMKTVSNRFL